MHETPGHTHMSIPIKAGVIVLYGKLNKKVIVFLLILKKFEKKVVYTNINVVDNNVSINRTIYLV